MNEYIEFAKVLKLFESHGWELVKLEGEYRIFMDYGGSDRLPWPIPVHEGKVKVYYVEKFKEYLKNKK